jgi:hypothetical protein
VAERFLAHGTALMPVVASNAPIAIPHELLIRPQPSPAHFRASGNPVLNQECLGPRLRRDERNVKHGTSAPTG